MCSSDLLSLHRTSLDHYEFLVMASPAGNFTEKEASRFLENFTDASPVVRNFEGVSIYDFQASSDNSLFAFAFINDFFAFSKSPLLVEDAVRMLGQGNNENPANGTIKTLASELSIRLNALSELCGQYFEPGSILSDFSRLTGQSRYQFGVNDNLLYLRGNISKQDTTDPFFNRMANQQPKKSDVFKVLSSRIAVLSSSNIVDYPQYYAHFISGVNEDIYFNKLIPGFSD